MPRNGVTEEDTFEPEADPSDTFDVPEDELIPEDEEEETNGDEET